MRLLARAAVGVPRDARSLVAAAQDLHLADLDPTAAEVLDLVGVDPDGLTDAHRRYLTALFRNGLQGSDTLRSTLNVSALQLRTTERLLLRHGYIKVTPQGRQITPPGRRRIEHDVRAAA